MTDYFKWHSRGTHPVKRDGFPITHAAYHTSTSVQGKTIRTGVTIDCGRLEPTGGQGMSDDSWWFHLYVLFSRATRMEDMLLLRPPPRSLVERGPPAYILKALRRFEELEVSSTEAAKTLCREFGIAIPEDTREVKGQTGRRRHLGKESETARRQRQHTFVASAMFQGPREGFVFKSGENGLGYYNDVHKS